MTVPHSSLEPNTWESYTFLGMKSPKQAGRTLWGHAGGGPSSALPPSSHQRRTNSIPPSPKECLCWAEPQPRGSRGTAVALTCSHHVLSCQRYCKLPEGAIMSRISLYLLCSSSQALGGGEIRWVWSTHHLSPEVLWDAFVRWLQ